MADKIENVIETVIVPEVPKVIPNQQLYVYIPMATSTDKGLIIAKAPDFDIVDGELKLLDGEGSKLKKLKDSLSDFQNSLDISVGNLETAVGELETGLGGINGSVQRLSGKVNTLENAGFITNAANDLLNYYLKSETYTKTQVNDLFQSLQKAAFKVISELPAIGESNIIYLLPKEISGVNDIYDEYIYTNNAWEHIGTTSINLDNYYTKGQVDEYIKAIDQNIANLQNSIAVLKTDVTNLNNAGFVTNAVNDLLNYYLKTEVYTKAQVNELLQSLQKAAFKIVDVLPDTGEPNIIYLLTTETANVNDAYDEYIYINNVWELIGSTSINLDNYYTKGQVDNIIASVQFKDLASFSIAVEDWTSLSNATPYTVTATKIVALSDTIDENRPLLFSYDDVTESVGIVVKSVTGSSALTITFVAVKTPTTTINGSIAG